MVTQKNIKFKKGAEPARIKGTRFLQKNDKWRINSR
nr:MAG TPA: hypothetical protein [Caudoviricetes sp.]